MTSIEGEENLERYESLLGELWESAVIRVSIIELDDGIKVPNGEIIFSEETVEDNHSILYEEGRFKIIERTVSDPFALLEELGDGALTEAKGVDIDLFERRPEQRFTGDHESRVFDPRPRSEIHAVYTVDIPEEHESEYKDVIDDLQDQLQRSSEPFFDIGKAEYYYFKHHFRRSTTADPEIFVFADTGIHFDINEEEGLSVVIPEEIIDLTAVSILPQRPYGAGKGWRTEFSEADLEVVGNGLVEYQDDLDFPDVEEAFIILFVGDEILEFEEFYNPNAAGDGPGYVNPRFGVLNEYDQRDILREHLQGGDSDIFEVAILNLFSVAGYQVQWFGNSKLNIPNYDRQTDEPKPDEIDVIAHRPDGSQILFIECTVQGIADKNDLLDRVGQLSAGIRTTESRIGNIDILGSSRRKIVPVIATSMDPDELSHQVVESYNERGVVVLDGEDLVNILEIAFEQSEPVDIDIERDNWDLDVF